MENVPIASIDEVDDIASHDEYQVALEAGLSPDEALKIVSKYSRDNARTPMQWTDGTNAGFTTGTPWLKVNPNYHSINVAAQIEDADSIYSFYKKLIALRKNPIYKETIVYGALEPVWVEQHNLMAYYRKGEQILLVVGNYQREEQEITLPKAYKDVLLNNYHDIAKENRTIRLHAYQVLVLEMCM